MNGSLHPQWVENEENTSRSTILVEIHPTPVPRIAPENPEVIKREALKQGLTFLLCSDT